MRGKSLTMLGHSPLLAALCALALPPACSARVAVVTGATRGIGRGIAIELGRLGHTVYALGRSSRGRQTRDRPVAAGLDLTVESTAEAVTAAGGVGHGLACDTSNDAEIRNSLLKISAEQGGKIDILVCSAYTTPPGDLRGEFWTQGMEMWDACNNVGLRGVYATCLHAMPALLESSRSSGASDGPPPLVILVSSFGGNSYTFNVAYGVGKAAIDRLASDMAYQLAKHRIGTISLYPGVVKTEGILEMEKQGTWAAASGGLDLMTGETPALSGKAVCALAGLGADVLLTKYSGKVAVVAELAKELGFAEDDGSVPPSIRSLKYLAPNFVFPAIERESGKPVPDWMKSAVPDWLLPWSVFSGGPPPEPN
jgi:dehydrogenase/reductase SDR family member 1